MKKDRKIYFRSDSTVFVSNSPFFTKIAVLNEKYILDTIIHFLDQILHILDQTLIRSNSLWIKISSDQKGYRSVSKTPIF